MVANESLLTDEVRSFLTASPPRYATIATVNPDGSPHQIPIWYLLRGEPGDELLVVNSKHGRRWPSNLRRESRANLCVYEAEDAVTIDCEVVEIYEDEPAQADIAAMAHRYDGPDSAASAIARFRTQRRVSFVLRPVKVHVHGDLQGDAAN